MLASSSGSRFADVVIELTTANLLMSAPRNPAHERFDGILTWIECELPRAELSVQEVAAAHHMSVRSLQLLFQRHGSTFSDWVRGERLRRIRADLADEQYQGVGIAGIASGWGMPDATNFAVAFRRAYGETPSAFRAAAMPARP